jgi:succinyl-diaminopimelate desuccinylase
MLCFAGHTDVVPPGPLEQWRTDPFATEVRDGHLLRPRRRRHEDQHRRLRHGVERFLAAASRSRRRHRPAADLRRGRPRRGWHRARGRGPQARGETLDYCIVGEPTSAERLGDTIKNGRRGSLSAKLIVKGVQGHIAYPHLVKNPVHKVAPALAELAATRLGRGQRVLSRPLPGRSPTSTPAPAPATSCPARRDPLQLPLLHRQHAEGCRRACMNSSTATASSTRSPGPSPAKPYLTPRGELWCGAGAPPPRSDGIDTELSTSGGTSDGRFIADICPQLIELGPLNASIHKIDECIAVADLEPLARIYDSSVCFSPAPPSMTRKQISRPHPPTPARAGVTVSSLRSTATGRFVRRTGIHLRS